MPNQNARNCRNATPHEIMAAWRDDRQDELLDAVVSAAALVARADGWVDPVERGQLLDFLDRNGFLAVFTRAEIFDAFERRVRELRTPGGAAAALGRLQRHAGRSPARLVVGAGDEVAAADGRLDPREQRILQLIQAALGVHPSSAAPQPYRVGETR